MYDKVSIEDTFLVLGIQDLAKLSTLKPVFVEISRSPSFLEFISKYPANKYISRFWVMNVTVQQAWKALVPKY